jgi:membrane peptidoglycan carboxypeptidase
MLAALVAAAIGVASVVKGAGRIRPEGVTRHRRRRRRRLIALAIVLAVAVPLAVFVASVPLPDDPPLPQASRLYYRDGHTLFAEIGVTNRISVPLSAVPEGVRHAVLAAEDRSFYDHSGVSLRGVLRAAWVDVAGGGGEGASTITQQYARNAYLSQERSLTRKAKEMVLAVKLENRYSKDQIFERYLNTIYFGRGAYGIAAAALAYFDTPVENLTVAQGALLASVIKDPWNFDPAVDRRAAEQRWQWVIHSMLECRWVDDDQARTAVFPEVLKDAPPEADLGGPAGLGVEYVERELDRNGISPQVLRTAGLSVVTTLDPTAQRSAVDAVGRHLAGQPNDIHAAVVAIDPANGEVRAYYGGSRGYGYFDDAQAARLPGSAFSPVVLAAGLAHGVSYQSRWDGTSPRNFLDRGGVPLYNERDRQCSDCELGQAVAESLRTPVYALAQRLGGATVRNLAFALGVSASYGGRPALIDGPGDPRPDYTRADVALGIYPVTPADLASVYATFADEGRRVDRHIVTTVRLGGGQDVIYQASPGTTVATSPAVAADVTAVLADCLNNDRQSSQPATTSTGFSPPEPRQAVGKSGTTRWGDSADSQDAWMAGYTRQLAAVVWVGRQEPGPIRDQSGHPITGKGIPMLIWQDFLTTAEAGAPLLPLPGPAHVGNDNAGDAGGP